MAGRFIAAEICPIFLTLTPTLPSGTRQTLTTVPHLPSPYTAPFPVRSTSPPHLFLCMQRPTRVRLVCLGACIVSLPETERFLRDLEIAGPPWGAFALLGPDFIYQISL